MHALIQEFSEYLRIEKRHLPHTVAGYCRDLGRLANAFPDIEVSSLTTAQIRGFLLLLRDEGL